MRLPPYPFLYKCLVYMSLKTAGHLNTENPPCLVVEGEEEE
jgi:hypothetical protein